MTYAPAVFGLAALVYGVVIGIRQARHRRANPAQQ